MSAPETVEGALSEYQYYEFLAIDRPLSARECGELRAISSRATITPTRFRNEYHYGDLKADPRKLLASYFDVHVYEANWGARCLALRLPADAVARRALAPYFVGETGSVRKTGPHLIIDFWSQTDDPEDPEESSAWMDSLAPLRDALLHGDMRPAWVAWMAAVAAGGVDDDDPEPPRPAGLRNFSGALESLADFLRIDGHLIAAGLEAATADEPQLAGLAVWIASLSLDEKDALLVRVAQGEQATIAAMLQRRFKAAKAERMPAAEIQSGRTAGEIRQRAAELREAAARRRAIRVAKERRRQQELLAAERTRHLEKLASRGNAAWREVHKLVATSKPKAYETATVLLVDLREIASRAGDTKEFARQFAELLDAHGHRPAFVNRLQRAGLLEHRG